MFRTPCICTKHIFSVDNTEVEFQSISYGKLDFPLESRFFFSFKLHEDLSNNSEHNFSRLPLNTTNNYGEMNELNNWK